MLKAISLLIPEADLFPIDVIQYYYGNKPRRLNIYIIVLFGTLLIIFTNLISGWDMGIVSSIGGNGEIYIDAVQISNPISFISDYESLQDFLTVHARTHPPGAVRGSVESCALLSRGRIIRSWNYRPARRRWQPLVGGQESVKNPAKNGRKEEAIS